MKFLIVKTSSLGDILQSFPVATYLHAKFPGCQIDWVVEEEFSELVKANPQVSHVLCVKTRQWRRGKAWKDIFSFKTELQTHVYDAVFDLQGNTKSGLITFLAKSKNKVGFGRTTVPEKPNLLFTKIRFNPPSGQNIRDDYLYVLKNYFSDTATFIPTPIELSISSADKGKVENVLKQPSLQGIMRVLVCPGSAWKNKQLTSSQLQDFLVEYKSKSPCEFLFCWGSEIERQLSQELSGKFPGSVLLEKLSLPALQHLMGKIDCVISMDSLPLHLAGTTSVSTYSFFGPSLAKKYCPQGLQHRYFQGNCPYGRTFEKRCPILRTCPTGACLRKEQN